VTKQEKKREAGGGEVESRFYRNLLANKKGRARNANRGVIDRREEEIPKGS